MKRQIVRQCLGLAVGLGLFGGCAKPSAQSDQLRAVVAPPPPTTTVVAVPPAIPGPSRTAASAPTPAQAPASAAAAPAPSNAPLAAAAVSQDTNGPAIEQVIAPAQPANMSPGVDEVVRLAQGGVSEEVMVAYIEKYPGQFNASADQIVYLNDLGVSSEVVTAMLKHDGVTAPLASTEPAAPTEAVVPEQQVSNVPAGVPGPAPVASAPVAADANAAVAVATPPATPPPSTDVAYFYDSLSPYGSWMYVSGYGWAWQPTVAMSVSGWRPYSHSGRWYWSDSGWYWHSDYSWGWAPFHYGRWYMHPHRGWLWTPGSVWGPAWVSWRYSDGYCGWAPLPPEAYWVPGAGFTYYGRHVAVGFDFGLSWHHYAFVPVGRFCDPHPYRHFVHRTHVANVYRDTRVVNHYVTHNRNVVNRGVGRETIARHNQGNLRQVRIESASLAGPAGRINRLENRGREVVAYRPELPKDPPVRPAVVQNRMAQDARQQQRIARVDTTPGVVNTAPRANRAAPAGSANRTPVTATPLPRRSEAAERDNDRPGRGSTAAPSRIERQESPASQPRVVTPRQSEPRNTPAPSRVEPRQSAPERSAPNRIERAPRSEAPSVRQQPQAAQNEAPRRVYAEPRSPSVAAPATATPRVAPARPAQPSASPRALERSSVYASPRPSSPAAPSYAAPRVAPQQPSYSAPRVAPQAAPQQRSAPAPSYSAPRGNGGGGAVAAPRAERVDRGGGGGGGGNGGGRGGGGGGGASRGDVARGDRNR